MQEVAPGQDVSEEPDGTGLQGDRGAILVSGLINVETTLRVEGFPIAYDPAHYPTFGICSSISGVGYNVAKALTVLGNPVHFVALAGTDAAGLLVEKALADDRIPGEHVLHVLPETPQSVILYDADGRRQINVDLKDIQQREYPADRFAQAAAGCPLAVLCNINHARPFLDRARRQGMQVATDVHAIADLEDEYNRDFMAAADILFMSDERLPCAPDRWARAVQARYGAEVVVIGMGAAGALLAVRRMGAIERLPAVVTRPVVSTIGAGDALFSAFVHGYMRTGDAYAALRKAIVFASYKIGEAAASKGFLSGEALDALYDEVAGGA